MRHKRFPDLRRVLSVATMAAAAVPAAATAADWPSWRGPGQIGMAYEKAAVTSWSQDGENVLWKVPVGGRTTPILMDGRLYAITPVGEGKHLGERVICLDADTGKTLWEHRFNVFHTDIVEARLGWTAVVGDPETGNVYAHGTGGEFFCFSRDGKVLWKKSLGESFGRYSGYGGRLHTPIIDEDRVIISYVYILGNWGTGRRKAGHRYVAFDKRTGDVMWWSQPGGKPLDTTYSVPVVTVINGRRLLIAGNADGNVYAMLARTGQRVWSFKLAKRGINTSVVVDGPFAYVTHSEEN
ncbi:MAG: PQQ-binding-like beta-propeller repeat protein, partial [Phycisphaerae bacterium]